jgi:hypothetical protein
MRGTVWIRIYLALVLAESVTSQPCPEGQEPATGSGSCQYCLAGSYSTGGQSACKPCPEGTRSVEGSRECCLVGYTLQSVPPTLQCGSNDGSDCFCDKGSLSPGEYISDGSPYRDSYKAYMDCWWIIHGNRPWVKFYQFQVGSGAYVKLWTCGDENCANPYGNDIKESFNTYYGDDPVSNRFYLYETEYMQVTFTSTRRRSGTGFLAIWGAESGIGAKTCQVSTSECSPGSYSTYGSSADACKQCDAGSYSTGASFECSTCPVNTYSETGQDSCTPCHSNTVSETTGSTSPADCMCLQQYYWEESTDMCVRCPTGTTSALGSTELTDCTCISGHTSRADGVVCDMCDRNSFKPMNGVGACTRCPIHSHSDGKRTICICDEGFYKDEGFYVETTTLLCKASDAILTREEGSPCECEAA